MFLLWLIILVSPSGTTTGGSRTATTCHTEAAGLHFQGQGLRAGTQIFLTFTHIMEATLCRAGELSQNHFCPLVAPTVFTWIIYYLSFVSQVGDGGSRPPSSRSSYHEEL